MGIFGGKLPEYNVKYLPLKTFMYQSDNDDEDMKLDWIELSNKYFKDSRKLKDCEIEALDKFVWQELNQIVESSIVKD